jgi:P2-related tail formation protein
MKSPLILLLLLALLSPACSAGRMSPEATSDTQRSASQQTAKAVSEVAPATPKEELRNSVGASAAQEKVSLNEVDQAELTTEAADRKIIRNANLTMEVASTTEAQHGVTSIAESHGGFVVTSEAKQRENTDPSKRTLDIKLVVRIPSERFGAALDEIKKLAGNLPEANVTGQDVTEEFIDLEARIKTQKALEFQFLEIMKQARNVVDALEIQRQIADVRTDIEKLEGRKRFLENRSSLSTITVNLQTPKMIAVSPTGFGHTIREAVSDSLEIASEMLVFFVRFVIVLAPVFVFVLLPTGLIVRYFVRRAKRMRLAEALAEPTSD